MLYYLSDFAELWGPFRLFKYLSVRCAFAAIFAFVIGVIIAPRLIAVLRRIKFGQSFRTKEEVGKLAELHASKIGTPTMGGLIIFAGVIVSSLFFAQMNALVFVALFVYTALTLVGAADDLLKIKKKNSKGVSGKIKLLTQAFITAAALGVLLNSQYSESMMELYVPFLKNPIISSMPIWFAFVFLFFVIAGSSNAINLTDGIDGLAIGCTVSTVLAFGVFAYASGNAIASEYLFLRFMPGAGELAVICCATLGASCAFLWFNAHPAEIFMGDTGSLALGGLIGAIAFMVHEPFTLVIVGGVFVMESLSVIIQVASFKTTGKRVFRISPIHHHFEQGGWKETQVLIRFWILSLIFALAGLATLKLR